MNDSPKPWQRLRLPPEASEVPAMLSLEERRYLAWVTAEAYEGRGAIVDLGPWLGGSSTALAEGLRRRGREGTVHCRDLFSWSRSYMPQFLDYDLPEGADFLPLFEEHTEPYREWLEVARMDLYDGAWDGGPIEILFVDAAKSWGLLNAILGIFGPHLIPGVSRVIHQDFRHFTEYFIPLTVDSRPDLWEEMESVDRGNTVTFRLRAAWDDSDLPYSDASFSYADAKRILEPRSESGTALQRRQVQLGLMIKALIEGEEEEGAILRSSILAEAGTDTERATRKLDEADRRVESSLLELAVLDITSEDGLDPATAFEHWARRMPNSEQGALMLQSLRNTTATHCLERAHKAVEKSDLAVAENEALQCLKLLDPSAPEALSVFQILASAWTVGPEATGATARMNELESRWAEHAAFHAMRAFVLRHHGQHEEARESLNRSLELDPELEDALRLRDAWA